MASDSDKFLVEPAHRFGDRRAADAGNRPVHDAGKFIDDGQLGHLR